MCRVNASTRSPLVSALNMQHTGLVDMMVQLHQRKTQLETNRKAGVNCFNSRTPA